MKIVPKQKPGKSKQDYATPPEFISAVRSRLKDNLVWDLAATFDNTVCAGFFDEAQDSLKQSWQDLRDCDDPNHWLWLNPPYADIKPWVEKAALESINGAHIAMLVPASTGANWWADYVQHESYQLFLNGRITFVGAAGPYPKDCALLLYTPFIRSGNAVWTWGDYK